MKLNVRVTLVSDQGSVYIEDISDVMIVDEDSLVLYDADGNRATVFASYLVESYEVSVVS